MNAFCMGHSRSQLSGELEGVRIGLVEEGFEKCDEPVASLVKDAAYKLLQAEATVTSTSVPQHHIGKAILIFFKYIFFRFFQIKIKSNSIANINIII